MKFTEKSTDRQTDRNTYTHTHTQIAALVVIVVGCPLELTFQFFVKEKPDANPPRLPWYTWFKNPDFYIVSKLVTSFRFCLL